MKVSFTGTHGIGKTTLAKWLAKTLEVSYIPEYARELLESGFQIDTPDRFVEFETTILNKKLECEKKSLLHSESLISDRSYLDYAVYLKHGLSRFPYDEIKNLEYQNLPISRYFNSFEAKCRDNNRIYDLVFFVTPFTEFISPEFDYREKNPFATNIIQDLLYNEYREEIRTGRVLIIREKTLSERKKFIIQALRERSFLSWNTNYLNENL